MNNKIVIQQDKFQNNVYYYDVTDIIKHMFGEFVNKALLEINTQYGYETDEYMFHKVTEFINQYNLDNILDEIRFDGVSIIIEFNNGNIIDISNSEWGMIEKLRKDG